MKIRWRSTKCVSLQRNRPIQKRKQRGGEKVKMSFLIVKKEKDRIVFQREEWVPLSSEWVKESSAPHLNLKSDSVTDSLGCKLEPERRTDKQGGTSAVYIGSSRCESSTHSLNWENTIYFLVNMSRQRDTVCDYWLFHAKSVTDQAISLKQWLSCARGDSKG